jgi:hypothetical protein
MRVTGYLPNFLTVKKKETCEITLLFLCLSICLCNPLYFFRFLRLVNSPYSLWITLDFFWLFKRSFAVRLSPAFFFYFYAVLVLSKELLVNHW